MRGLQICSSLLSNCLAGWLVWQRRQSLTKAVAVGRDMHMLHSTCPKPNRPTHPRTHSPTTACAAGPAIPSGQEPDLDMRVLLVDGDETIADSAQGGLAKASEMFKAWIAKKWPANEAVAA